MKRVIRKGADAVVTKSLGPVPREGNHGPVLAVSHGGLLNAVGLTNPGIDAFSEEMASLRESGVPIIMSIFGSTVEEIVDVAVKAASMKPSALELNLSCPHAEISQISHDPDITYKYVKSVRDAVDCKVFAKLTPNASDIVAVGRAAERAGADGVVAVNTVRAMKIDIYQKRPVLGNRVGGLSGPPIFPIAVRCVHDLFNTLSIPIIGVGGVSSWQDAVEMHLAGASAIQIGTAAMSGLDIFLHVKAGVGEYLRTEGYGDVSDIIGLAARR
jgi:dihydroorotate dehydrogenase (NAD+) catalytic subunit